MVYNTTMSEDSSGSQEQQTTFSTNNIMPQDSTPNKQLQEQRQQRMPTPVWAPLLKYVAGIEVRHLVTPDEVTQAKRCLYQIYHVEQGWNPGQNPSGLRVEEDRLEDDLTVDWFGILREGKLIGVGRSWETSRLYDTFPRRRLTN